MTNRERYQNDAAAPQARPPQCAEFYVYSRGIRQTERRCVKDAGHADAHADYYGEWEGAAPQAPGETCTATACRFYGQKKNARCSECFPPRCVGGCGATKYELISNGHRPGCRLSHAAPSDSPAVQGDPRTRAGYRNAEEEAADAWRICEVWRKRCDAAREELERVTGERDEYAQWVDEIYSMVGGRRVGMTLAEVVRADLAACREECERLRRERDAAEDERKACLSADGVRCWNCAAICKHGTDAAAARAQLAAVETRLATEELWSADLRAQLATAREALRSILGRHDLGHCTCGGCSIARAALSALAQPADDAKGKGGGRDE